MLHIILSGHRRNLKKKTLHNWIPFSLDVVVAVKVIQHDMTP